MTIVLSAFLKSGLNTNKNLLTTIDYMLYSTINNLVAKNYNFLILIILTNQSWSEQCQVLNSFNCISHLSNCIYLFWLCTRSKRNTVTKTWIVLKYESWKKRDRTSSGPGFSWMPVKPWFGSSLEQNEFCGFNPWDKYWVILPWFLVVSDSAPFNYS